MPFSLNQPNSLAMYSGHCSAPWLTNPSTIFVCACAFPSNPVAQTTTIAAVQAILKLNLRADLMICSMAFVSFHHTNEFSAPQKRIQCTIVSRRIARGSHRFGFAALQCWCGRRYVISSPVDACQELLFAGAHFIAH